jgi:hypothetical protein
MTSPLVVHCLLVRIAVMLRIEAEYDTLRAAQFEYALEGES